MALMNPMDSLAARSHLDITPKWVDIQTYLITCSAQPRRNMIAKAALLLVSLLLPFLASASTIDLYGRLLGKTPLVAPGLPSLTNFVPSDLPADRTNAIARIEDECARNGISVVHDGPHFVRLLPAQKRDRLLREAPLRGSELQSAGSEVHPAGIGVIDFHGADLAQVLLLYGELSQRTVLRPAALASSRIELKTVCPLSRDEATYALVTVLALNGIAIVEDGDHFVQAVWMAQRTQVKPQAPKREPNARLFDPKKVPAVGVSTPAGPTSKVEQEFERLRRAFYNFIHYKGPPVRPAFRLLELYANLTNKKAVPSKQFDGASTPFRVQTPLSKSELLYAIETTLNLNNLAIVPADDQTIRLGRIGELSKNAGKQDANPRSKQ